MAVFSGEVGLRKGRGSRPAFARILIACVAASLLAGAPARANHDKARRLYAVGQAAFTSGRFLEAARAFEASYAQSHRYVLLWNIAQAFRRQFEVDHSVDNLRRAQSVYNNFGELATTARERNEAKRASLKIDEQLRLINEQAAAAALAARPAPEPTNAVSAAPPPSPPSAATPPAATPAPPPTALLPPTEPRSDSPASTPARRGSVAPGLGLAGAGVAVVVAGAVLGGLARGEADTVTQTGSPAMPAPFSSVADDEARGRAYEVASYVCYGIGGAATVIGAVLAVLRPTYERKAIAIVPTVGGALVEGRF